MSNANMRRLLILSCSARKKDVIGGVPAWELYDGVAFRVVKRCEREGLLPTGLEIVILSALHGIITPETPITFYDLKMTADIAARQRAQNGDRPRALTGRRRYDEIFLMMGRTYLLALEPLEGWCVGARIIHEPSDIGVMLRRLKAWLRP